MLAAHHPGRMSCAPMIRGARPSGSDFRLYGIYVEVAAEVGRRLEGWAGARRGSAEVEITRSGVWRGPR